MIATRLGYSIFMLVAAIAAGCILRRSQGRLGLSPGDRWTLAISGLVGATLAAKLPFWIFAQTASPAIISLPGSAWLADGKTILWALAGGYGGVELGKWMLDIRARTGDTFVVAVAVAVAIGRLGCLTYGCCHGAPSDLPWAMTFAIADDGGTVTRHPTQFYESIFHFSFALLAVWAIRRRIMVGDWMPIYLAGYAAYRFASEWLRTEQPIWAGMTFYQLSAIPIATIMIGIVIRRRITGQRPATEG